MGVNVCVSVGGECDCVYGCVRAYGCERTGMWVVCVNAVVCVGVNCVGVNMSVSVCVRMCV